MAENHLYAARATAGRAAVIIASEHDRETARDMTFGLLTGMLLACVQYDGWDSVLHEIHELAAQSRGRAEKSKPTLVVNNSHGEVA